MADLSSIEHVVLLCMENRSFDHYLGALSLPPYDRADVHGLTAPLPSIPDVDEKLVQPWQIDAGETPLVQPNLPDVPHAQQNMVDCWNEGANDGFLRSYQRFHAGDGTLDDEYKLKVPLGYYTGKTLPVLYSLAEHFTVCDNWFASMLSSTWPNRKYLHSGRRDTDQDTQLLPGVTGFQTTPIYAFLEKALDKNGRPLTWKSYFSDLPFLAFWYGFAATHALRNFATVERFVEDCRDNTLPSVSIVDPAFTVADDHPPHDPQLGQKFIGLVVDALTNSPSWDTTALIIVYDEAGGFYDHAVLPPADPANGEDQTFGFRVPALIVSPYAKRRFASHALHDHTSFIASLKALWDLQLPADDQFGVRWPAAKAIWNDAFDFAQEPQPRGIYTGEPLSGVNWAAGVRERLTAPLGKFEALLERIFVLPELKTLDRRSDVYDTLGKMEDNVVMVKRMQSYGTY